MRITPAVLQALEGARHVPLSTLPAAQTFPNHAFDKQQQQQGAPGHAGAGAALRSSTPGTAARAGAGAAAGAAAGAGRAVSERQQMTAWLSQLQVQSYDRLLTWGDLARMLPEGVRRKVQAQVETWLKLVGPTSSQLVYSLS